MSSVPWPSLADFAQTWREQRAAGAPPWAYGPPQALPELVADEIEAVLDTIVSVQRAEWLQDGVWLGPRSMPDAYKDLLHAARTLGIAVPPATVTGSSTRGQGTYGTDDRAFLHLSSFFLHGAPQPERRFLLGRLCGHVAARQVSSATVYALLVDQGGLRQIARKALGPALEVFLAPLSLGARLALSRGHRAMEVTADRAGLLCAVEAAGTPAGSPGTSAGSPSTGTAATQAAVDAAGRTFLRMTLGVRPEVRPDDWLAQADAARAEHGPAKWAELLSGEPWLHKRLRALEMFARSTVWEELGRTPLPGERLPADELERKTTSLLEVL